MGRHRYSPAHWQDVTYTLHKMTHWEKRSSLLSSPEIYSGHQHIATSLLAVVTLWWIVRRTNKQSLGLKNSVSSHPVLCCVRVVADICKPLPYSLLFGIFLLSLISIGSSQHVSRIQSWEEDNRKLVALPPKFIWHLFQAWRDCYMGSMEVLSLFTLSFCSINLIMVLLLLCGDVEVNPGPFDEKEEPLRGNNFAGIKQPKSKLKNIDYEAFCRRVQFVISTVNNNELNAALTVITSPDIEKYNDQLTTIDDGVHIGMIETYAVGLIHCIPGLHYVEFLKKYINKWFPNAKYLVAVGICYGFSREDAALADVLIADEITNVGAYKIKEDFIEIRESEKIAVKGMVKNMFCQNPSMVEGLEVASGRRARHFVGRFMSFPNVVNTELIKKINSQMKLKFHGGDAESSQLLRLQKDGIEMPDGSIKYMEVIIIKGVIDYLDGQKYKKWQFIGAQAAFHYVKSKMSFQGKMTVGNITEAMGNNMKIVRKTAQIFVLGLPGVGKSSLICNLLGREEPKESTPFIEGSKVIVTVGAEEATCSVALIDGGEKKNYSWEDITHKDYLRRLVHEKVIMEPAKPKAALSFAFDDVSQSVSPSSIKNDKTVQDTSVASTQNIEVDGDTSQVHDKNPSIKHSDGINNEEIAIDLINVFDGIDLESLKNSSSINIWDTGGQLEFQEFLSILLSGPSIVIFVLNTACSLNEKAEINYRKINRTKDNTYKSVTPMEGLLQTLATIDAMERDDDEKQPEVFIVGAHIDEIKGSEEVREKILDDMNKDLHRELIKYSFKHLVRYRNEQTFEVMYKVNNKERKNDEYFNPIRETISATLNSNQLYKVKYCMKDLLFCLYLSFVREEVVLGYSNFVDIAKCFGIHEESKIEELLKFLQKKVGVIRYYNVKNKHFIICQPNKFFRIFTEFVVMTFRDSSAYQSEEKEDLLKKGAISAEKLLQILNDQEEIKHMTSKDEFTAKNFLELLKDLHIVGSYQDVSKKCEMYFVPTALNHADEDINDSACSGECLCIAFKGNYCPKGIFITLVAMLVDQKEPNESTKSISLTFQPNSLYRNKVKFLATYPNEKGSNTEAAVSIKGCLTHIEVGMKFMESSETETQEAVMCTYVQERITHLISKSIEVCKYNEEKVKPFPGYKCQQKGCDRFCEVTPNKSKIYCTKCMEYSKLPSGIKKFFSRGKAKDYRHLFDFSCVIKSGCIGIGIVFLILLATCLIDFKPNSSITPADSQKVNSVVDISKSPWFISASSEKVLFDDLKDIGDWESLCTYLEVNIAAMEELRYSPDNVRTKKQSCLRTYIKSGKATWDHVVRTVRGHPFNNYIVAKKIAEKHGVPFKTDTQISKDDL